MSTPRARSDVRYRPPTGSKQSSGCAPAGPRPIPMLSLIRDCCRARARASRGIIMRRMSLDADDQHRRQGSSPIAYSNGASLPPADGTDDPTAASWHRSPAGEPASGRDVYSVPRNLHRPDRQPAGTPIRAPRPPRQLRQAIPPRRARHHRRCRTRQAATTRRRRCSRFVSDAARPGARRCTRP